MSKFVGSTTANYANPTQLDAGYKANVVPGQASAVVDVRFLPGQEDAAIATLHELAGRASGSRTCSATSRSRCRSRATSWTG